MENICNTAKNYTIFIKNIITYKDLISKHMLNLPFVDRKLFLYLNTDCRVVRIVL